MDLHVVNLTITVVVRTSKFGSATFEFVDSRFRRIDEARAVPTLSVPDAPSTGQAYRAKSSEVSFDAVAFTDRKAADLGGTPAMRDVSLVIAARSLTALVGSSREGRRRSPS